MVQLIKIDRLGPRIEGMLYKLSFDENWALLDKVTWLVLYCWPFTEVFFFQGARTLSDAGRNLLGAKQFKQLLSVCRFSLLKIVPGQSHVFQSAYTTHWQLYERHWYQRRRFWLSSKQYQQGKPISR
jgi:hypothetical protein